MKSEVRKYLSKLGRKGGKSRSKAKIEAGRRNIAKATKERKRLKQVREYVNGTIDILEGKIKI